LPYVSLSDNLGAVSSSFNVRSVPTNVLIDANGIVYLNQPGKISEENLRKALEDLWEKDS
jgi:thioredoxin-related protein